ncbi:hypothetical protein KIN20_009551 [Parelaphostrongylus tenuis]|uniref:Uncharacterized protein n=1 Tax=Parelaphostrongylus tenuis TaxID=148309 RepID=A0AAD5MRY2_PARTN|nr:hypothetical protein KIN20_009551 [Parelaphostrongylus tenuis]
MHTPSSEVSDEEIELIRQEGDKNGAPKRRRLLRICDLDPAELITQLSNEQNFRRLKEAGVRRATMPLLNGRDRCGFPTRIWLG